MTFVLHWSRDGGVLSAGAADRLVESLTRLRDGVIERVDKGPVSVFFFSDVPGVSVSTTLSGQLIFFSGRLDAIDDLRAALGHTVVPDPSTTDADLVAAAYTKWEGGCFEHLVGDFVAIVWDEKAGRLLCARDVVGIAPCFYWSSASELVVAGHVGGVVSHPSVRTEPNEGFVAEVLSVYARSRHETIYRDVWRLVAGHALAATVHNLAVHRWGRLEPAQVPRYRRIEEYDEHYRNLLSTAVQDRMRSPSEAASELSGGLDSPSVAVLAGGIAVRRWDSPVRTFSMVYPGISDADESQYIEQLVTQPEIDAEVLVYPPVLRGRLAQEVRVRWDLPSAPIAMSANCLLPAARRAGFVSLLTGQGGDHLFYPRDEYPSELLRHGRVSASVRAAHRLSPSQHVARAWLATVVRPVVGAGIRRVRPSFRTSKAVPEWITPELAWRSNLADRLAAHSPSKSSSEARLRSVESGFMARIFDSWAVESAIAGVTWRHPFFDSRFIAFALGLGEEHRWRDGQFRTIQRGAMVDRLPDAVRLRTDKADFGHVMTEQFRLEGGRAAFTDMRIGHELGWIDSSVLVRYHDELESLVARGESPTTTWPLWSAMATNAWIVSLVSSGSG